MEDALTIPELRALAAVLVALEKLDLEGARASSFSAGIVERVRVLPTADPVSPYREQARPSEELYIGTWAELRTGVADLGRDGESLRGLVQSVVRDEARALIFALAYEAAVHCAITPREASFLQLLEEEWNLSVE